MAAAVTAAGPSEPSALLMPPPTSSSSTHLTAIDEARLTDDDIDALITSLQPSSELDHLRNIEKTIRETQLRRRRLNEESLAKIHALETSLSDLKKTSTRQAAEWRSLSQHAETIEKLDNRNFDLAKKINEQESTLSSMQTEIAHLRRLQEDLEEVDVEEEVDMDKDALCLRIFRGLGFLPSKADGKNDQQEDEWSSILVRSDTRNTAIQFDVQVAHLKQNEISPLVLADQMWKAAE